MRRSLMVLAVVVCATAVAAGQEAKPLIAKITPGEVRTYDFEQDLRIQSTVEPQFQNVPGLKPTNRAHRIAGQLVVTYDAADIGAARVQLRELKLLASDSPESQRTVSRWLSDMGSRKITLRWPREGAPQFIGMDLHQPDELDKAATQMLQMMIVIALDPDVSKRAVKPGERWVESPDKPGESPTHNWYQRDVTVAGRSCALLLIESTDEGQAERFDLDAEAKAAGVQGVSRTSLHLVGAGLFDHQAEKVAMVKSAVTSETTVGVVSADRDAEVRVPVRVMTVRVDVDTITRMELPGVAQWKSELARQAAAIDLKSGVVMAAATPAAATAATPAAAQAADQPAGGDSLGDIARRAREAKKKPR